MAKTKRATKVDKKARVYQIVSLILQGRDYASILDVARTEDWGVSSSQIYKYIAEANEEIKKYPEEGPKYFWYKNYAMGERLFNKSLEAGEGKIALEALMELNRMSGFSLGKEGADSETDNSKNSDSPAIVVLPYNGRGADDQDPIEHMDFEEAQKTILALRDGEE